ncbi:endonuclease [Liberiplasma polymorphum]|uniref:endonuclease n=1 Tax=Liberiplasma polymorphum TaxID=3374570 RepID=UPI0037719CEB
MKKLLTLSLFILGTLALIGCTVTPPVEQSYTVTLSSNVEAELSVSPGTTVSSTDTVTISTLYQENETFSHWLDIDKFIIFSTESTYTFQPSRDYNLKAVYVTEDNQDDIYDGVLYDLSAYAYQGDHPYPNTSTLLTIGFTNPYEGIFSYLDDWQENTCIALDEDNHQVDCFVYGEVDTNQLGEHLVVYYAIDSEGNYASVAFKKTVLRDASLLTIELPEYYKDAEGLFGLELKLALRSIISDVAYRTYGDARYDLQHTDRDPDSTNNIIQIYTRNSAPGTWSCATHATCNWNREHIWPVSRMPYPRPSNTERGMGTDLHNLAPSDINENDYKGAKYFTETHTSSTYNPDSTVRGNVARVMFYMDTMYAELKLVSGTPNANNFEMGDLDYLITWHFEDPVSDFERNRNNLIYGYQNNRNPFIDVPHFVELIWYMHPNIPLD